MKPAPLALIGSGEYQPQMAEIDRRLLERSFPAGATLPPNAF